MALQRNVANANSKTYWSFVESTTERVNRWPEWKREAVSTAFSSPKPVPQPAPTTSKEEVKND
jgi:hypothetical protein